MARFKPENKTPPWTPLQEVPVPPGDWPPDEIPVKAYVNSRYQVWVYEIYPRNPIPGQSEEPLIHLSIKWHDRRPIHDWRDLQRIKNEICGPEREGVELYPAESRLVDTANQFHLWILPKGQSMPFGYRSRAVTNVGHDGAIQRPFEEGFIPPDVKKK